MAECTEAASSIAVDREDVGGKELRSVSAQFIEMRAPFATPHSDDVRESHFQQTLVATRDAETARLYPAERHTRVSCWNDEIINKDEAAFDARRECACFRNIAREDRYAKREARRARTLHGCWFVWNPRER